MLALDKPVGGGGGGRGEGGWQEGSACADFNLQELPCYLSNTHQILPISLQFIGEQDFVKLFCQGHNLLPIFETMFSQILTLWYLFLLINDYFKTISNYLSQSQEIDIIS